jgi:hypothetical protein
LWLPHLRFLSLDRYRIPPNIVQSLVIIGLRLGLLTFKGDLDIIGWSSTQEEPGGFDDALVKRGPYRAVRGFQRQASAGHSFCS